MGQLWSDCRANYWFRIDNYAWSDIWCWLVVWIKIWAKGFSRWVDSQLTHIPMRKSFCWDIYSYIPLYICTVPKVVTKTGCVCFYFHRFAGTSLWDVLHFKILYFSPSRKEFQHGVRRYYLRDCLLECAACARSCRWGWLTIYRN